MIYIVAPLIFVGLILVLVLILMVFQKFFAGDRDTGIVVNNDKRLDVESGSTLLSGLAAHNIFIPSACGGKGSCGLCKVEVPKGAGEPMPQELPYLSREERKKDVRLSCQVKVNGEIGVKLPDTLLNAKKYKAEVVMSRDLTYDIKELRFRLIDPEEINFKAGSYVQLIVPEYYEEFRAYSISNAEKNKNEVELMVRLVQNGLCSTYAHCLEEGDTVYFTGPYSDFELDESEDTELILVGGGVGMAPIRSLALSTVERFNKKKISVYFGCRAVKDMIYYDEFKSLSAKHPNFVAHYALSDMEPEDNWTGATGFIHLTLDRCMNKVGKRQAFLCGPPLMINAVTKTLKSNGLKDEDIFWDDFGV
jgi:Na+-transporting NADH:ubiquinone oxidoreductase subunit F